MIDLSDHPELQEAFQPILDAEKRSQDFPSRPDRWWTTEESKQLLYASLTAVALCQRLTEKLAEVQFEKGLEAMKMEGE